MATVISGSTVKLNNGQTVQAQQGGWYDAQQFWGGSLSAPGVINSQSNQQGAGQAVSAEVNRQTSVAAGKAPDANQNYIDSLNGKDGNIPGTPGYTGDAGGGGSFGGGGGLGALGGGAPTLNLPDLYTSLSKSAGITDIESKIADKTKGYNDAVSKINDNPYLSESDRSGRAEKLRIDFNNDIKNDQDNLAMKKQDVQTQLDLQTKQFDINSQQAKFALDQFNTLLSSGALAGASGNDIAQITKATGISSSMIQSAISSQAQKDRQTSVTTVDDGKNIYSVVIDTKTGQIINKQVLSSSKPVSAASGLTTAKNQVELDQLMAPSAAYQAAKTGKTLPDLISFYGQYGMKPQEVYDIYNSVNYYKPTAQQIKADQKRYNVK